MDRLNREIVKAVEAASGRERLQRAGASPTSMTAQAFAGQLKRQVTGNAALVKAVGLEAD